MERQDILDAFDSLKDFIELGLSTLRTDFRRLEESTREGFLAHEKRFDRIDWEIVELKSDVAVIKADVDALKTDVAVLKTDVAVLKTDVAVIKSDVAALQSDVKTLQSDVTTIKSDVSSLKSTRRPK